jgi:dTDP-4-amino-4,6-dideoxygalactose transaminase
MRTVDSMNVPIARPGLSKEVIHGDVTPLRSDLLPKGFMVGRFEQNWPGIIGSRYVVEVAFCTTALHLPIAEFGPGPFHEAIFAAFTSSRSSNNVGFPGDCV